VKFIFQGNPMRVPAGTVIVWPLPPRVKLALDGRAAQPEDQSAARPGLRKGVHAALRA